MATPAPLADGNWLTMREAAERLKLPTRTVLEYCQVGKLEAIKSHDGVGYRHGVWLIHASVVDARIGYWRARRRRQPYGPEPTPFERKRAEPILTAICAVYGIGMGQLFERTRLPEALEWRWIAYHLLYHDAGLPLVAVARVMERDHSTIFYGLARFGPTGHTAEAQWGLEAVRAEIKAAAMGAAGVARSSARQG